jgi:hypothetical protein
VDAEVLRCAGKSSKSWEHREDSTGVASDASWDSTWTRDAIFGRHLKNA